MGPPSKQIRIWITLLGVWILAACARGGVGPVSTPTSTPTSTPETLAVQPSPTSVLPTSTATSSPAVTGLPAATLSDPAYPAPAGGGTASPAAPTPAAPAPGSPPPYPGPAQTGEVAPTALPPPYPGVTASPAASSTPAQTGTPAATPTPPLAGPPSPTATPAATSMPTRTPGVRPTVVARDVELFCVPEEGQTRCSDPYLGIEFAFPSDWGEIVKGELRPEAAGAAYAYETRGSLRGLGRSGDFIPPLGSGITAFPGFYSELLPERCRQFSPAQICQEIQPEVILVLVFPDARAICNPRPEDLFSPLAILAVNLPDHPDINGFVFYRSFLSAAQEAQLAEYRADLLGLPDGRSCTNFLRSRFNVRVLEMVAGVRNNRLDELTAQNVARLRALGESLRFVE